MKNELPLAGVTVGVTRAKEQSKSFIHKVESLGGIAVAVPLLSFQPPKDKRKMMETLSQIHTYDWLVLTSANGVHFFLKEVQKKDMLSLLGTKKIAVVGKKTEEVLQSYGLQAALIPEKFIAENLTEELQRKLVKGNRVLIVKGNLSRNVIYEGLKQKGFPVDEIIAYETVENHKIEAELLQLLTEKKVDYLTFTSPSTVNYFIKMIKANKVLLYHDITFVTIGPITAQAARDANLQPLLEAEEYTVEGMVQEMIQHIRRQKHD